MSFVLEGEISWDESPSLFKGTWCEAARILKPQGFQYERIVAPEPLKPVVSYFSGEGESIDGVVKRCSDASSRKACSFDASVEQTMLWNGAFNVNVGHGRQKAFADTFMVEFHKETESSPTVWQVSGKGKNQVGTYSVTGSFDRATNQMMIERAYDTKPIASRTPPKPKAVKVIRSDPVGAAETISPPAANPTPSNVDVVPVPLPAEEASATGASSRKSARTLRPNKLFDTTTYAHGALLDASAESAAGKKRQRSTSTVLADALSSDQPALSTGSDAADMLVKPDTPAAGSAPAAKRGRTTAVFVNVVESVDLDDSIALATARDSVSNQLHGRLEKDTKELEQLGMLAPSVHNPVSSGWNAARILDDVAGTLAGEIYEGELVHGVPHGFGCACYRNGLMYEGQWVNGKESGRGVICDGDDLVIYQGDVADGQLNGTGTFYYGIGDKYIGQWKDGLYHGRGRFASHIGASYDGEWCDGLRHGVGTMILADGTTYTGAWKHGQKHGKGEIITPSGFKYKGLWSNDVIEGKGEAIYTDGSRYEGGFKDGKREGRGTYFFPDTQQYCGKFVADAIDTTIPGSVLMPKTIRIDENEWMIPLNLQTDLSRIHLQAGFDKTGQSCQMEIIKQLGTNQAEGWQYQAVSGLQAHNFVSKLAKRAVALPLFRTNGAITTCHFVVAAVFNFLMQCWLPQPSVNGTDVQLQSQS